MTTVVSPVTGRAIELAYVPDRSFAQGEAGPGLAIEPVSAIGKAVAPIDGVVTEIGPFMYTVEGDDGRGVKVHLGIGTERLTGDGFHTLVARGARVRAGQPVVGWDVTAVEAGGCCPMVPVVALDAEARSLKVRAGGSVVSGDALYDWW
ncbi:PTS system glucose-specific IIA component [Stackebrandtia albiflava]|uniref:PTS system glucose-specific IIA component n=1 Tax=Stackebrandtia albiflava TaxID=406432 RepID=A0A562UXX0_9ACTN|nr:PTS glucose transporter subunit IIA [Stackebrandtia albiflava]TWJ10484.1 PTS system glucose-specific IIA component [Stackebrandtia albiflava]